MTPNVLKRHNFLIEQQMTPAKRRSIDRFSTDRSSVGAEGLQDAYAVDRYRGFAEKDRIFGQARRPVLLTVEGQG
jgi:hypothetical protein